MTLKSLLRFKKKRCKAIVVRLTPGKYYMSWTTLNNFSLITTFCFKKNTAMFKNELQCSQINPLSPCLCSPGSNEEEIKLRWFLNFKCSSLKRIIGLLPSSFPLLSDNLIQVPRKYKTNRMKLWKPFRKWDPLVQNFLL